MGRPGAERDFAENPPTEPATEPATESPTEFLYHHVGKEKRSLVDFTYLRGPDGGDRDENG